MLEDRADIAVHSFKDVPMELDVEFAIGAVLERADAADAFISNDHARLDALPHGARVGTWSLRRQAQLRALRPDLELLDLRGNVNTRLAKLDAGEYDAIILAVRGPRSARASARGFARASPRPHGCRRLRRVRSQSNAARAMRRRPRCSHRSTTPRRCDASAPSAR